MITVMWVVPKQLLVLLMAHMITGPSDTSGKSPIMVDRQHCDNHVSNFSGILCYKEKKTDLWSATRYIIWLYNNDITTVVTGEWQQWWVGSTILLSGWILHVTPYMLVSRVLFLHHYLPAVPFLVMFLSAMLEHLCGLYAPNR